VPSEAKNLSDVKFRLYHDESIASIKEAIQEMALASPSDAAHHYEATATAIEEMITHGRHAKIVR
jgi:hypothetical protein